jgi:uncharacterized repeat protein (TIGR02543 family)
MVFFAVAIALCLVALPPVGTASAQGGDENGDGYHDGDFARIASFLCQPSAEEGQTNGQRINAAFDANDAATWTGVVWNDAAPRRVCVVGEYPCWQNKSLSGSLDLSGMTQLTDVDCSMNRLTEINLSGATALRNLFVWDNALTSLDPTPAISLEVLDCSYNRLTSLDVSGCAALVGIKCDNNQIASLDLSGKAELQWIDAADNLLESLGVSDCPALTSIGCRNNRLTTLNLGGCPALQTLFCASNRLCEIDVADNPALTLLRVDDNELTGIDTSGNPLLEALYCSDNRIVSLDAGAGLGTLCEFQCTGNPLTFVKAKLTRGSVVLWADGSGTIGISFSSNPYGDQAYYVVAQPLSGAFGYWTDGSGTQVSPDERFDLSDGNYDLTANFLYTVDFDSRGGSRVQSILASNGSLVEVPGNPVRTGYAFGGWYREAACVNAWDFDCDTVTQNMTLYAKWNVTVFAVTFDSKGGSAIEGVEATYGSHIAEPASPSRYGYVFGGWFLEPSCVNAWDFARDAVTANLTLYADWIAVGDANRDGYHDGDFARLKAFLTAPSGVAGQTNGRRINALFDGDDPATWAGVVWDDAVPKRVISVGAESRWRGKSLCGALDLGGLTQLREVDVSGNAITALGLRDDSALFALYVEDNLLESIDLATNTALASLDCDGNRLGSLDLGANGALVTVSCRGNLLTSLDLGNHAVLEALYADDNRLATLNLRGCTMLKTVSCEHNELALLYTGDNAELETLFCGDNLLSSMDVSANVRLCELGCGNNRLTSVDISRNRSLYSLNCENNLIAAFDSAGTELVDLRCTGNPLTFLKTDLVDCGRVVLTANGNGTVGLRRDDRENDYFVIATPKSNYAFGDWTSGGYPVSSNEKFVPANGNYSLTANFLSSVAFDSLGGSTIKGVLSPYNATIAEPQPPTRAGHAFSGWYREAEGRNAWNFATNRVTDNMTLYAGWVKLYTVSFDTSGGSTIAKAVTKDGSTIAEPAEPMRARSRFNGWFRDEGCTVAWNFALDRVTGDMTLYASWLGPYDVVFDSRGGTALAKTTAEHGSLLEVPKVSTRRGYLFGGWCRDEEFSTAWNFATDRVTADMTLYAKWITVDYYQIKTSKCGIGTVTGGGAYGLGVSVTLTAEPKAGYRFDRWLNGKYTVSADPVLTFAVTGRMTFKAVFKKIGKPAVRLTVLGYDTARVSWKAVPYAAGYEVYRSVSSRSGFTLIRTMGGESTPSYTDTGLPSGTKYYYKVRAYCVSGPYTTFGGTSSTRSVTPKWPSLKVKLTVRNCHDILVSWNAVAQAKGYEVYRGTSAKGPFVLVGEALTDAPSYLDAGLSADYRYYYKVRPYDVVGGEKRYGAFSGVKSAKPKWPTIRLTARPQGAQSVLLGWNAVVQAKGYEVVIASAASGPYVAEATAEGTLYLDIGLEAGKAVWYRVRAYDLVDGVKVYGLYSSARKAKPV